MPDYQYIARDASGRQTQGTIVAPTERDAVAMLSGRSLFPVEVQEDRPARGNLFRMRGISANLLATTYGQLASLLRSGVPLLRSLEVLRDQTSNVRLREVLDNIYKRVEEGASLAEAMARHPHVFREMAVNIVRAGGEGGFLEDALERVAAFTEEQQELKSRTMGAVAYPVFLGVVGTLVVIGLLVFVVPRCEEMFGRLRERGELPAMTDLLLNCSAVLRSWGGWILVGLVFGLVALRSQLATDAAQTWLDRVKLKLPMAGKIFENLAVARFCRILGTLLQNGVPILKSLEISRQSAGNRVLSRAVAEASENVSAGESLAAPLAQSGHFPRETVEMIAVAEEANTLERVLVEIADNLERRTSRRLDLIVRLLEPVMLLLLAGMILMVVIALLLPILKMSSTL